MNRTLFFIRQESGERERESCIRRNWARMGEQGQRVDLEGNNETLGKGKRTELVRLRGAAGGYPMSA